MEKDALKRAVIHQLRLTMGMLVAMVLLVAIGVTGTLLNHWLMYASWGGLVCALLTILTMRKAVRLLKTGLG